MQGRLKFFRTGRRLSLAALLMLSASGCSTAGVCEGEPVAPLAVEDAEGTLRCGEGQYLHSDLLGGPDGEHPPEQVGSLRCYDTCTSDSDCQDPCLPHCSVQGLFSGTDFSCHETIRLCRAEATDDCSVERPR